MNKLNSSFWLDDKLNSRSSAVLKRSTSKDITELIKLASVKTAVSNFVRIVTNKKIPVTFNERGDSYTDGESVVISGSIKKDKDFDVMVGLALHEGSHILLSDFDLLKEINGRIPLVLKEKAQERGVNNPVTVVKNLTNYVEDRRIDYFIYSESPGYREYYRSMYDKYFNDRLITKTIQSNEYTDETLESYIFRIINLHADESDLSKLNGLKDIYRTIDLQNISRLKSSEDAFNVAMDVFEIILDNIPVSTGTSSSTKDSGDGKTGNSPSTSQTGMERDENDDSDSSQSLGSTGESLGNSNDESNDTESGSDGDESNDTESGSGDSDEDDTTDTNDGVHRDESKDLDDEAPELTERQKKLIKKKIEKQKKFLNGDVRKTSLSQKDIQTLEELSNSDIEIKTAGEEVDSSFGDDNNRIRGVEVIVANKLTDSLFNSEHFPLTSKYELNREDYEGGYIESVKEGIKKGRILAKKLQVRSEERTTMFNRQKRGKMDKRMIASLGFGNENVFYYKDTDSFNDLNLHISIDASGSMSSKWDKTMVNIVTLIQAIDIIPNIEVQVTMRTTYQSKPYIVRVYNSKTDSIMKVKKMFPYLRPGGTTPEGLTFEAIMDNFISGTNTTDSYFLNISDGQPYFHGNGFYYGGETAENHTKKQVNYIRQRGIKVLSYYVESGYDAGRYTEPFKKMYGKGSKFIDISNIKEITRTMNKFFLEK